MTIPEPSFARHEEASPGGGLDADRYYCREKIGGGASSRHYSLLFLPPERRDALTALYAFQREIEGIAVGCQDTGVARLKLDWWRDEIRGVFAGRPNHPVGRLLVRPIADCALPSKYFFEAIAGLEADLTRTHYRSANELTGYCRQVASTIELLAAGIAGYSDPGTRDYAGELGVARRWVEILCDLGQDARRGKLYLPAEDLERFGVDPGAVLGAGATDALPALLEFEARRAREQYQRALDALPEVDRPRQLPGLIMAEIQLATLREIRADGYRVLRHKVALTPLRKLWLAWATRRREERRRRAAA